MNTTNLSVGEILGIYRKRQKLSQLEVASRSGVSRSMIALIETNRANPSIGIMAKIATALGVSFTIEFEELNKEEK